MFVQNLGGTSQKRCYCDSWLDHWEEYSDGTRPRKCAVRKCWTLADVGGHVIINNSDDKKHYIIPLCKGHNNFSAGTIFEIDDSTPLAEANIAETCGRYGV